MNRKELQEKYGWTQRDFDIAMINGLPCEVTSEGVVFNEEEVHRWLIETEISEKGYVNLLIRRLKLRVYDAPDFKGDLSMPEALDGLEEELKRIGVIE